MAKEINIARLAVDMVANTATYRSQLAEMVKQTDKRLKELEKTNQKSNSQQNSDDNKAAKAAEMIAKKRAKAETEAYAEASRRQAKHERDKLTLQQSASRKSRSIAQQAGFQLQDTFVQAQMGIQATTIIAQQGSQFLGAFGAAGALAGAALAIGAVGVGIFNAAGVAAEKQAQKTTEGVIELADAITKLNNSAMTSDVSKRLNVKEASDQLVKLNKKILKSEEALTEAKKEATKTSVSYYDWESKRTYTIEKSIDYMSNEKKEVDKLTLALKQQTDQRASLTIVASGATKESIDADSTIKKLTESLKLEIEYYGKGSEAIENHKFAQNGANKTALANLKILQAQLKALEDKTKAEEKAAEAAKKAKEDAKRAREKTEKDAITAETNRIKTAEKQAAKLASYSTSATKSDPTRALVEEQKTLEMNLEMKLISEEEYQMALLGLRDKYTQIGLQIQKTADDEEKRRNAEKISEARRVEEARRKTLTDTYNFERNMSKTKVEQNAIDAAYEQEILTQKYADQQAALILKYENDYLTDENYLLQKKELEERYAEEKAEKEAEAQQVREAAVLGDVDQIADAFGVQLKAQETYAKTQAAISAIQAGIQVWSDPTLSFYAKIPASIAAIGAVSSLAGQFHGGTDSLPSSMDNKSFMLKAGERVVQPEANKKLTKFLDNPESSGSGVNITSTIQMGPSLVDEKVFAQALSKQQSNIAALMSKEERKRPSRRSVRSQ